MKKQDVFGALNKSFKSYKKLPKMGLRKHFVSIIYRHHFSIAGRTALMRRALLE
jgi:hypothetical protein